MTPTTKIEPELPELPYTKWGGMGEDGKEFGYFAAEQMRAYALSAIAADRNKREKSPVVKVEKLDDERTKTTYRLCTCGGSAANQNKREGEAEPCASCKAIGAAYKIGKEAGHFEQPNWAHVGQAFVDGAREARQNPDADDVLFKLAADGYTKRLFEQLDPISEQLLRQDAYPAAPVSADRDKLEGAEGPEGLTIADYEEVLFNYRKMVRELDVLLNGEEGAAPAASLGDILAQVKLKGIMIAAPVAAGLGDADILSIEGMLDKSDSPKEQYGCSDAVLIAFARALAARLLPPDWVAVPMELNKEMLEVAQEYCDILPPRATRLWKYWLEAIAAAQPSGKPSAEVQAKPREEV